MIFLYRCTKCGVIELDHKIGIVKDVCPSCNSRLRRVFKDAPSVLFKGVPGSSGFHKIDYGSSEDKKDRMKDYGDKLNKIY